MPQSDVLWLLDAPPARGMTSVARLLQAQCDETQLAIGAGH
jgi:hypothetical protein